VRQKEKEKLKHVKDSPLTTVGHWHVYGFLCLARKTIMTINPASTNYARKNVRQKQEKQQFGTHLLGWLIVGGMSVASSVSQEKNYNQPGQHTSSFQHCGPVQK